MKKIILAAVVLLSSAFVNAKIIDKPILDYSKLQQSTMAYAQFGSGWTVGDSADYSIDMSIVKGTMHSFVREIIEEGIWMQQDMDMGMFGKQKIEILLDPTSGEILALIVNGKKQTPPSPGDMEVIDVQNTNVTVKAGTFECLYVKIKNKSDGKISQAWLNQDLVPMGGMLKQKAPSQFGEVTVELTKYNRQ